MDTAKIEDIQKKYSEDLVKNALELQAVKLSPSEPFTWASGAKMPIYNDNRRFLAIPKMRKLIASAFSELLQAAGFKPDWIAGTATAGIPHSVTLADLLNLPVSYVRASEKTHGLKNKIEGIPSSGYGNSNVLIIEDLISTGGSSINAVKAVREAGGQVLYCFAIFSYGFKEAENAFAQLEPKCTPITILTYPKMIKIAEKQGFISQSDAEKLADWSDDPFGWAAKHGF